MYYNLNVTTVLYLFILFSSKIWISKSQSTNYWERTKWDDIMDEAKESKCSAKKEHKLQIISVGFSIVKLLSSLILKPTFGREKGQEKKSYTASSKKDGIR